jgi:hypothetical protein
MKILDLLQDAKARILTLDEPEDAAILELLYLKYLKLYHEYLCKLPRPDIVSESSS